jgi:hypothetical protein
MGKRKWSWNPHTARRMNGCANPVDRVPGVRDTDGHMQPEWKRPAILPPDFRKPVDDPDSPLQHPENFSSRRMWHGYFEGAHDPVRAERADMAVRKGKCVAMGCVAGTYEVAQILRQIYSR